MLDLLLGLKLWQLTVVVLGISLAVGLGFSVGIRRDSSASIRALSKRISPST